jgi:hypothetical protein
MADPAAIANTNQEPVWVAHNDVLLGYSETGDITLTINQDWSPRTFAQTGTFIVEDTFLGAQVMVSVSLSEVLDYDKWVTALPFGRKQADTATPANNRFVFQDAADVVTGLHIGAKASALALPLRIMPASSGSAPTTETSRDFWIPKAYCKEFGTMTFGADSPQSLDGLIFHALYDPDALLGQNLAIFGLETEGAGAWADV